MKLVIIRHPETNGIAGLPGDKDALSPKGKKRLQHIASVCQEESVQAVIGSTMPRATPAANDLALALGAPLTFLDELQERHFGEWDKWDWPQISLMLGKLDLEARYTFKPPGGESWEEMDIRLLAALKNIATLGHDSVAVMTHAGPIRVLLTLLGARTKAESIKFIPALGSYYVEAYGSARE